MAEYQVQQGSFQSADGRHTVAYTVYCPNQPPMAVLQVCHGMAEHRGRYRALGEFLAESGVAVCIHDHLGHGETADPAEYGWFGGPGSRKWLVADAKKMTLRMKSLYPHLPYYIMGHSMGSFVVRLYLAAYPDLADGGILMGTGQADGMIRLGRYLATFIARVRGSRYRSQWLQNQFFRGCLSRITSPKTPFDWLSRDGAQVAAYQADPACGFLFSVGGLAEISAMLCRVSGHGFANRLPDSLPVLFLSGEEDPVGHYGKDIEKAAALLQAAGLQDVSVRLYPGARHELLNELDARTVMQDLLNWILFHAQQLTAGQN